MNTCKQRSINSHDTRSCCIETSLLICSANQWTGFCIIGTSVIKDSRRSSSSYTDSLFLHVVKDNFLLFFAFFFYLVFLSRVFMIHRTAGEEGGYLSTYILPTTSARITVFQTLAGLLLQRNHLCAQLAAGIEHRTFGTCTLEFTLSALALVAAVVRMLITRVTLGYVHVFNSQVDRLKSHTYIQSLT